MSSWKEGGRKRGRERRNEGKEERGKGYADPPTTQ